MVEGWWCGLVLLIRNLCDWVCPTTWSKHSSRSRTEQLKRKESRPSQSKHLDVRSFYRTTGLLQQISAINLIYLMSCHTRLKDNKMNLKCFDFNQLKQSVKYLIIVFDPLCLSAETCGRFKILIIRQKCQTQYLLFTGVWILSGSRKLFLPSLDELQLIQTNKETKLNWAGGSERSKNTNH